MTLDDLTRIKVGAARATPGPWKACGCGKCGLVWAIPADTTVASATPNGINCRGDTSGEVAEIPEGERRGNAAFVASARTDVPALVEEVERLRRWLERIRYETESLPGDGWDFARQALSGAPAPSMDGRDERKDAP